MFCSRTTFARIYYNGMTGANVELTFGNTIYFFHIYSKNLSIFKSQLIKIWYLSMAASLCYFVFFFVFSPRRYGEKTKKRNGTNQPPYLSHMRAAKIQTSLRICAVSSEPSFLSYTKHRSNGMLRPKFRLKDPLESEVYPLKDGFTHMR